ncbi:hypothetical protein BpHYR1_044697 [Brachionus plicatilis]|uniref:Uncharacterized protein n=1 Tax=Brachionus plicatilis TaxID=10195 RepID=A0A3M7PL89_BRAPC|nr:hypothetical protein BpHYR1_044697 [Brachionus plicatilis]
MIRCHDRILRLKAILDWLDTFCIVGPFVSLQFEPSSIFAALESGLTQNSVTIVFYMIMRTLDFTYLTSFRCSMTRPAVPYSSAVAKLVLVNWQRNVVIERRKGMKYIN